MSPRKATAVATPVEENIFEAIALPEQGVSDPEQALKIIQKDLGDCKRCELHKQRKHIVFGEGNAEAELMFVGEGPGADEDEKGKPFVGRPAGERLTKMITAMGTEREQVYIANIVKCRPPDKRTPKRNRKPDRGECAECSQFLRRQIDVIKPKVIVALGATAAKTLLNTSSTIAQLRRDRFYHYPPAGVRSNDPNWNGCKVKVTYHPASRRGEWQQGGEAWKDLQMVMKELGLKGPKQTTLGRTHSSARRSEAMVEIPSCENETPSGDLEKRRHSFRPDHISTLFVGESRPKSGRFFYERNSLLYHKMKEAFEEVFGGSASFLDDFKGKGFFLDDLSREPINHIKDKRERKARRREGVSPLAQRMRDYQPQAVVVVMCAIEPMVVDAMREAGLGNLKPYVVPFPRNEHLKRFKNKMADIIPKLP